ncbi:MAG: restriction endonuclease [Candidatus Cloacimonetes bacterium]|nr:restriction endonuclease [Candidatus Cloacimonadota bacterium]
MKVLWVDDSIRTYLRHFLGPFYINRCIVNLAQNNDEAEEYLREEYDIIITDIRHPIGSKYEHYEFTDAIKAGIILFNEIIKTKHPNTPCLFFTVRAEKEIPSEIMHNQNVYYLQKFVGLSNTSLFDTASLIIKKDKEKLYEYPELDVIKNNIINLDFKDINNELVEYLSKNPQLMYKLSSRKFEELIASLLKNQGYIVELTKRTRDGGKDIYITDKSGIGTFCYIVECKKYRPDRPVGVEIVRSLYGVVEAERVNAGILITTSNYTKPATDFQMTIGHRLKLKDFNDIKKILQLNLK